MSFIPFLVWIATLPLPFDFTMAPFLGFWTNSPGHVAGNRHHPETLSISQLINKLRAFSCSRQIVFTLQILGKISFLCWLILRLFFFALQNLSVIVVKSQVNSYDFRNLRVMRHKTSQLTCRIEFYKIGPSLWVYQFEFRSLPGPSLWFYEFSLVHNFEVRKQKYFRL